MPGLSSSPASVVKTGSSAKRVSTCQPGGHRSSLPKVWSFLFEVKWTRLTQPVEGAGLRLGGRRGAAVGLVRGGGGRPLVVVVPAGGEVAVEVHSVARGDAAVAVDVAQVLAPQAVRRGEGVVVAVGVRDQDEPELALAHEAGELAGAHAFDGRAVGPQRGAGLAVVVQEQAQRPPAGLTREPLARMLDRRVEDRRAAAVGHAVGVRGDAHRVDRHPVERVAERDQLGDPVVAPGQPPELGGDVRRRVAGRAGDVDVGPSVRAPDLPTCRGLSRRGLPGRATAPSAQEPRADPCLPELVDLLGGGHDLDAAPPVTLGQVEALPLELTQLLGPALLDQVGVQLGRRGRSRQREHDERRKGGDDESRHSFAPPHVRPSDPPQGPLGRGRIYHAWAARLRVERRSTTAARPGGSRPSVASQEPARISSRPAMAPAVTCSPRTATPRASATVGLT